MERASFHFAYLCSVPKAYLASLIYLAAIDGGRGLANTFCLSMSELLLCFYCSFTTYEEGRNVCEESTDYRWEGPCGETL